MRLVNARTDRILADRTELADTRKTRKKGLLGRDSLPAGSALIIVPCFAVHTIGMRFPIDVVFVDAHGRVKKIVKDLPPLRLAGCASARAVVEMAAGTLVPDGLLEIGDRLCLELGAHDAPPPMTWASVSPAAG
jgi:uncharacterized membrane protein (UPF0127 family)